MAIEYRNVSKLDKAIDQRGAGTGHYYTRDHKFDMAVVETWIQKEPRPTDYFRSADNPNGYEQDEVQADKVELNERRTESFMKHGRTPDSVAFKYGLMELIQKGWLKLPGSDKPVKVTPTHLYDYAQNGADFVLELPHENGNVPLIIETTTTSDNEVMEKLVGKTNRCVRKAELNAVKYFPPADDGGKPGVQAPRIVIGTDKITAAKVQQRALETKNLEKLTGGALLSNPDMQELQARIIDETILQLTKFLDVVLIKEKAPNYYSNNGPVTSRVLEYIRSNPKLSKRSEAVNKYAHALDYFVKLKKASRPTGEA